jgi:hypothetical protein
MPAGAPPEAAASVLVNLGILRRLTEFWWPTLSMQLDRLEHRVIDAARSREDLHVPHSGPLLRNTASAEPARPPTAFGVSGCSRCDVGTAWVVLAS